MITFYFIYDFTYGIHFMLVTDRFNFIQIINVCLVLGILTKLFLLQIFEKKCHAFLMGRTTIVTIFVCLVCVFLFFFIIS